MFQVAKEGMKAVEFDVLLTSDNIAIVFHDHSLIRMTNCDKLVEKTEYEEIQKLDISVNHPFR